MTWSETALLLIGCAAVLAVLRPQRKRTNTNPPPTYPKPPAPPAPPPVGEISVLANTEITGPQGPG